MADTCEQVFNQDAVRAFAKFERRALQFSAGFVSRYTQLNMSFQAARQAALVVKDHNSLNSALLLNKARQILHGLSIN